MKRFAQLNYDNFIIEGEVNEQLPLYDKYLENIYPLDGSSHNMLPDLNVSNGIISVGDQSKLISKQNVSISNDIMNFSGSADSYIQLNGDLFGSKNFDIIFDFQLSDMYRDHTLLTSDNITIGFDSNTKKLFIEFHDIKGEYSTIGDFAKNKFSLCDANQVIEDKMNNLTIHRFKKTILVYLNHTRTRLFILKANTVSNNIYIGRGLYGKIENFSINDKSYVKTTNVLINSRSTMADFSLCFNFKMNKNNVTLLEVGTLVLKVKDDKFYANSTLLSDTLIDNSLYGISIGYKQGQTKIIIYNMDNANITSEMNLPLSIQSNTISTKTDVGIFNLGIYYVRLSDKILLEQHKRRFHLDKSGDIKYEINEIDGHNRLNVPVGEKYHLQLTRDLVSDCENIAIKKDVEFVEDGVLSKNTNKPIKLLFAEEIGLMNSWSIVYKTYIKKLTSGIHYDSLGEGLYWGIEDNSFIIKYINGQSIVTSKINGLTAQDVLNEPLVLSVSHQASSVKFIVCCSKGIFESIINKNINDIGNNDYDLFLGGKDNIIYGEAIYRELTIVSNWIVSKEDIENMFRIKFSYENNMFKSNVKIIEK